MRKPNKADVEIKRLAPLPEPTPGPSARLRGYLNSPSFPVSPPTKASSVDSTMELVLLFRRVPVLLPAYLLIGGSLLLQLLSVFSGNNQAVACWAHIGGFVAGAPLVVPFRDKQAPLFDGGLRR